MNQLTIDLVRLLEAIFVLGVMGSGVVLILTTLEDIKELLGHEHLSAEPAPSQAAGSEK